MAGWPQSNSRRSTFPLVLRIEMCTPPYLAQTFKFCVLAHVCLRAAYGVGAWQGQNSVSGFPELQL